MLVVLTIKIKNKVDLFKLSLMRLSLFLLLSNIRCYCRNMSKPAYQAGSVSACYVTAPDEQIAKKLAHGIISKKLAACVNIIPRVTSIYEWEGKVNEDSEVLLMIKTKTSRVDDLSKYVRENHPYSVAEVISTPIENGNPPYLKWIQEIVPEKSK